MKGNILNKFGKRIYQGLGNPVVVIVLFVICLILGGLVLYGYYHAFFIAPRECCVDVPHPLPQTEYGLYSVNDFLQRDDLVLERDGLRRSDYSDSDILNITLFGQNRTWAVQPPLKEVIPFSISNPSMTSVVSGVYTPNLTISGNTISMDILVVNWNDTAKKGGCYQVSRQVTRSPGMHYQEYKGEIENLGIAPALNRYGEIRVNLSLTQTPDVGKPSQETPPYRSLQTITIAETNCTVSDSPIRGSWAVLQISLESGSPYNRPDQDLLSPIDTHNSTNDSR